MTRQEYNREILSYLSSFVETYPDCRFNQILESLDITNGTRDNYYIESKECLDKIIQSIKKMVEANNLE